MIFKWVSSSHCDRQAALAETTQIVLDGQACGTLGLIERETMLDGEFDVGHAVFSPP